jgi:hypothetical protein
MNRRISTLAALVCLLFFSGSRVFGQLQNPTPPVNIILDSDMSNSVDDVGDHAVLWALANRGEVNVLAVICSSADDTSAPLMHAIATYYGHPNVLIGAHQGSTPTLENSATSNYTQQMVTRFGISGDTRANYPDAVTVYRQALAGAPDHSVYIVANGYWQPLQGLLQSPADSISPLTGVQLVAQKVLRLVPGAGFFPSGNEHDFRVDADAASFVYANWPVEIVNVGVEVSQDVFTAPDFTSATTTDPIKASYVQFNGGNSVPGFGQVPLLFAVRGLGANFTVPGFNGQTTIENFSQPTPGQNNWFQTPQVGHSYIAKQATAAQLEAILNPLLQSSSNMPILRTISPSSVAAGSGQTITLTGTNFFSDSQVQFNGSNRPTTFVSATQLSAQLSSSDLQAGQQALTVANSEGGGWTSNPLTLTVTGGTTPSLTAISPTSAIAGSGPVTLTATGSNFVSTSVVQVNGANRSTTFVSGTQLTATLTASDTSTAGSLSITVNTPGSGTSASLTFTVANSAPSLTSISPNTATAGGPAFTLTANGSNFVNGATVQVNGSNRTTTFVSGTQLTASIPSSDIASAGTLAIGVINPDGSTTGTLAFTVNNPNNPQPALASISPTSATAGSPGFTLTVTGSNFVSASVVRVNGASRTTTFVSNTQLTATIPASDIASTGSLAIGVINPDGSTTGTLSLAVNNPPPSLASISPTSATAGSPGFTLTVTGSNFVSASVVRVNGASRTTTFVSATQLTAAIPASDIASAGTLSVTVFTPTPGGGTSTALAFTVTSPPPSLTSISPSTAIAGGPAFTLTATGSNFVSGSIVQVNGANRTTTFVSSTQLTAAIPASDIASTGSLAIGVINPDGSTTGTVSLAVNNPPPSLASISPTSATAGSPGFTLTVTGSNFVSASVVRVNGASRTTTFVSNTQLTATIPASDIASPGTLSITVFTASPGGGTSGVLTFNVNNPVPSLTSISPNSVVAGSAAFTLTVNGSNFVGGSVVQINGAGRPTTFVSNTQLTASISASDIASTGNLSITVSNAAPGGGTSSAVTLAVVNPAPSLANISPNSATAGSAGFTLTVNGSDFISSSVVQVNGSNRTTTFVSGTQLTAAIPASDLAVGALLSITVFTPAPGGGTSSSVTFTVNNPAPSISSISPNPVLALGGSFTLTVNGSGFVTGSVVQFDGSPRPTTFVSATQVTAQISSNDIIAVGQHAITVFNPTPGGGTSNSSTLTVVSLL